MPSVNSQNIILVAPEVINIVRGQQAQATVTLHQNYVGNELSIGAANEVILEFYNTNNVLFKTESKQAGTLNWGNTNQISVELTGQETLALPMMDNNVQGEVFIRVKVTLSVSEVILPTMKIGNVYDAGKNIAEVTFSRYGVPSAVYKVSHLGLADYGNTNNRPTQGQILFNSANPSQVTRIMLGNLDDKGYRNEYLENLLEERLDVDSLRSNIFFTNVDNNS